MQPRLLPSSPSPGNSTLAHRPRLSTDTRIFASTMCCQRRWIRSQSCILTCIGHMDWVTPLPHQQMYKPWQTQTLPQTSPLICSWTPMPTRPRMELRQNSRSWFGSGCQTRRPSLMDGGVQESTGPCQEQHCELKVELVL